MIENLPKELQIHIFEYSAERMPYYLLDKIPRLAIAFKFNMALNEHIHSPSYTHFARDILCKHITEPEHVLKILANCKCCMRHQNRRPATLHDDFDFIMDSLKECEIIITKLNMCNCSCRTFARHICRMMNTS